MPSFQPYWGKPAVRNDRGDRGDVGIIRSPVRASILPDSVSYNKIGAVLVAQGNLLEALKSYRDSLAIADRLAQADLGNAGWQYDLGISNERIGDVLMAQGDLAGALKSYQAKHDIISRLAKADPGNASW